MSKLHSTIHRFRWFNGAIMLGKTNTCRANSEQQIHEPESPSSTSLTLAILYPTLDEIVPTYTPSQKLRAALRKVRSRPKARHPHQDKVVHLQDGDDVEIGEMRALKRKFRGGNKVEQKRKIDNCTSMACFKNTASRKDTPLESVRAS